MVERFFRVLNRTWNGLHEAAFLMAAFALGSQLLGLVRDRLLASRFGAGETLDVYYAAFRIPDLIFASVASLAAVTVLVPFFFAKLDADESRKSVRNFMDGIFTVFASVIAIVALLAFFFAPTLARYIVPGFSSAATEEFVFLTRLLLLSPLFFGLSNLFGTITQSLRIFSVFAAGPVLYNVGILLGIFLLAPIFGIRGVAVGVIIGAFFHMAVQIPVIVNERLMPRLTTRINWSEVMRVAGTSLPRTAALASTHIAATVLVALASTIKEGSIAVFTLAMNLQSIPLAIVGVSYSVAAFPTLARLHVRGERSAFLEEMVVAARHIIFWSVPAMVLFIVLRAQIVRTALGAGAFDWTATRLTAAALACFAISVVAQSLILLLVRGYYAMGDTRTPLFVNVSSALLMIAFALLGTHLFANEPVLRYFMETILRVEDIAGTKVLMLPLAYALATIVNLILLFSFFIRAYPEFFFRIRRTVLHIFSASIIMGFVVYHTLDFLDDILPLDTLPGIFLQGLGAGSVGLIAHLFILRLLGNAEMIEIAGSLKKKFWTERPIAPEPEAL